MGKRPRVSIIMPSFNSERFLRAAAESILSQTFSNFELIIIEDGSTDTSPAIAYELSKADRRTRVVSTPTNGGAAEARNLGIKLARGAWLAIADSDDLSERRRLEAQVERTTRDEDLVVVASDAVVVDSDGKIRRSHRYPTRHRPLVRRLRGNRAFPPHSSMMYRRAAVLNLRGFDRRFEPAEDYQLLLRLAESGRFASVDQPLVRIRRRGDSFSNLEGGRRQIRHAMAAAVCARLRLRRGIDPSATQRDDWIDFVGWIDEQLERSGIYDLQAAWDATLRPGHETRPDLVRRVLTARHGGRLLADAVFGSPLPRRLARRWVNEAATRAKAHRDR